MTPPPHEIPGVARHAPPRGSRAGGAQGHDCRIADSYLLTVARDDNAPIVTNDRYRDWADDFPEIARPGRLIRGGYRNGTLWLDGIESPAPA